VDAVDQRLIAVPRVCWFIPMHHRLVIFRSRSPNSRQQADLLRGTPEISSTRSGV
jgi:hypothetical protein